MDAIEESLARPFGVNPRGGGGSTEVPLGGMTVALASPGPKFSEMDGSLITISTATLKSWPYGPSILPSTLSFGLAPIGGSGTYLYNAKLANNGNNVVLTGGSSGYVYTTDTTFAAMTTVTPAGMYK